MNINDLEKLKLIMQNSPKPFDRSTVPFLPEQRTALEMQGFQDPFFNISPGSSQEPLPQQNIIPDVSAFSQNVKNIKLAEEEAKRAEEMAKREGLARMLMALGDALKGEDVISNAMQRDQMFRKKENEKRKEESISNFKELVKGTEFEEIANALGDEFAYNLYGEYTARSLLAEDEPPRIVEAANGKKYFVDSEGNFSEVFPGVEKKEQPKIVTGDDGLEYFVYSDGRRVRVFPEQVKPEKVVNTKERILQKIVDNGFDSLNDNELLIWNEIINSQSFEEILANTLLGDLDIKVVE